MPDTLDFASNAWGAYAPNKKCSYVIGMNTGPDPSVTTETDPTKVPLITVFVLDRLDSTGNQTRLGANYPSIDAAHAAAQSDANT